MAVEMYVYLCDSRIPSRVEWQEEIDSMGIDLELDKTLSVRDQVGFVPVRFGDVESGFELYVDPITALSFDDPTIEIPAGYDRVVAFRFVAMEELVVATYAAAALVKASGGLFYDEESNRCIGAAETVELARRFAADAGM